MRFVYFLLPLLFLGASREKFSFSEPVPVKTETPHKYFTATTLGFVKDGGTFNSSDGCTQTNLVKQIWTNTRKLGQIGVGDVVYDENTGTTPVNGLDHWWGFCKTSGGSPTRSLKINSSGVVTQIAACVAMVPFAYASTTATSNCANTNFVNAIYATPDDPDLYENKPIYVSSGGQTTPAGNYTASYTLNGPSFWTYTVVTTTSRATSVACCSGTPISLAGADATFSLPSPSITLSGSGIDCDGTINAYSWSQISGPNTATISNSAIANPGITGVIAGNYTFRLQVTDNSSNTATDDVVITIVPAPLCIGTPTKIPILPYMCWDLSGALGYGGYGYNGDTSSTTNKWGAWLGKAYSLFDGDPDPGNPVPQYDWDLSKPGFQVDATYPILTRQFHNWYDQGSGSQRCIFVDLGKTYYISKFYWYDSTNANVPNAVEVIFCHDLEEARKAVFQFDTRRAFGAPTIDYTLSCDLSMGWKVQDLVRDSCQFIVLRYNDLNFHFGAGFSSYAFYGCASPFGTKDTRITPDFTPFTRDTTKAIGQNGVGFALATGVETSFLNNTVTQMNSYGGYIGWAFSGTSGLLDKNVSAVNKGSYSALSTYKVDLAPYGDINLFKDSGFVSNKPGNFTYIVDKCPNARLMSDISNAVPEYIPLDSVTADPRLDSSYDRFWRDHLAFESKVGSNAPDTTQGFGPFFKFDNDPFPGRYAWGRAKYVIGYNENWAGFRSGTIADANYMSTTRLRAFEDKGRREAKKIFGNNYKFVGQGNAAGLMEGWLEATKMNQILYLDKHAVLSDIVNYHSIICTNQVSNIDLGTLTGYHSRGEFPGYRGEFTKLQSLIDTLYYISGVKQTLLISEAAYSSNKNYIMQEDPTGAADGAISNHSAKPIKSYYVYESQGIMIDQMRIAGYAGLQGFESLFMYELRDAADSNSVFYNNSDANDGIHNLGNSFFKPGFYMWQQTSKWLKDYRVVVRQVDSLNGQVRLILRNINPGKRDSFCTYVAWQNVADAPSPRSIPFATDVTQVTDRNHVWPDDTNYNGVVVPRTVTANSTSFVIKPEGDFLFYKSTVLASQLDAPVADGPIRIKVNKLTGVYQSP